MLATVQKALQLWSAALFGKVMGLVREEASPREIAMVPRTAFGPGREVLQRPGTQESALVTAVTEGLVGVPVKVKVKLELTRLGGWPR